LLRRKDNEHMNVYTTKSYIIIDCTYEQKEIIKAIGGMVRYDSAVQGWLFHKSPITANAIHTALKNTIFVTFSDKFNKLLVDFEEIKEAGKNKTRDNLGPIPITMQTPWLHQLRAFHFAKNLRACGLFLDMGTGKTKVVFDLILNSDSYNNFVICPNYVKANWLREYAKHGNNTIVCCLPTKGSVSKKVEHAKKIQSTCEFLNKKFIFITNYEATIRPKMRDFLLNNLWDYGVLDEGHRIKAPGSKVSMLFRGIAPQIKNRIILTGTPTPNNLLDIYAQYRYLDKGIFGSSFYRFRDEYAVCNEFGQPLTWKKLDELTDKIYSIAYRVESNDVLDLPESNEITIPFDLNPKTRRVYEAIKNEMVAQIQSGVITAANAAVKTMKLRQVVNGFSKIDLSIADEYDFLDKIIIDKFPDKITNGIVRIGNEKENALKELLFDIQKEPIVIFCSFHVDMDIVKKVVTGLNLSYTELSGRVKVTNFDNWQAGKTQVLIAQIDAAKEGIDCTRARYGIFYGSTFSPGTFEQAKRRILRPGQENPVVYYYLVGAKTIDESIYKTLSKKQSSINTVINNILTDMMEKA